MEQMMVVMLTKEVIASIIIIAALILSVRALLTLISESTAMGPQLQKLEADLKKYRGWMDEKKTTVQELSDTVEPLRTQEVRLRTYYDALKTIELNNEKEEAVLAAQEEFERKQRIQRRKMRLE